MTLNKSFLAIFIFTFYSFSAFTQGMNEKIYVNPWNAFWISHPNSQNGYNVFHFRKIINLQSKPSEFIIHISADPRFRFFINGQSICTGPAKGDTSNWHFNTIDIASHLQKGKNILAAVVWNDGEHAAWSQISFQTGFLIQGYSENEELANTNSSWKVYENISYSPLSTISHITGAGEQIFGAKYPWNWEYMEYNDDQWTWAKETEKPVLKHETIENYYKNISSVKKIKIKKTLIDTNSLRRLIPSILPFPIEREQNFARIRNINGAVLNEDFISGKGDFNVPAWADVKILIDQDFLTTAYPKLLLSGGKGARVTLTYAEALFNKEGNKGNRNDIEGKTIQGNQDVFLPDGGERRLFIPHWYRAFRYVELHIENHQDRITIHKFNNIFTAYPFEEKAFFNTNEPILKNIWNVGWHTAKLCAYDTYMDCPYYEQLQYIGDTRIQALISLYVSGDDRLMRNAILQFHQSMIKDGLTQSRYPSNKMQVIAPFSLFWIHMIHDFWMLRQDDEFIKQFLPDIKRILQWHKQFINGNSMLGKMPFWNFVDWTDQWIWKGREEISGIPAGALEGNSSILTLQYVWAMQKASELFNYYGKKQDAFSLLQLSNILKRKTFDQCWDNKSRFISDTPDKKEFSQHAQALAVLTGTFSQPEAKNIIKAAANSKDLIQCSFYYRFYLLQALKKAGLGDNYISNLYPWKNMLEMGLSTFSEKSEPTRSDCHAWSASPNYDFLATVCGIEAGSPGFKTVNIEPHLGDLTFVEGKMPHPTGEIFVKYSKSKTWQVEIILPKGIKGDFYWKGKKISLQSGRNFFKML